MEAGASRRGTRRRQDLGTWLLLVGVTAASWDNPHNQAEALSSRTSAFLHTPCPRLHLPRMPPSPLPSAARLPISRRPEVAWRLLAGPDEGYEGEEEDLAAKAERLEAELARLQAEIERRKANGEPTTKKGGTADRFGLSLSASRSSSSSSSAPRPNRDPRALERKILFDASPEEMRSSFMRESLADYEDLPPKPKNRGRQAFIEADPIWGMESRGGKARGPGRAGGKKPGNNNFGSSKNGERQSALRDSEVVDQLLSSLKGPAFTPKPKRDLDEVADMLKARYSSKARAGQADSGSLVRGEEGEMSRAEVREALRQGSGADLLKRVMGRVDEGLTREEVVEDENGEIPSKVERLTAWGQLLVELVANQGYSMSMDTMLRARELALNLLPFDEFSQREVTTTNLAVIQEVADLMSREVPLRKKTAGSNLFVLLRLPFNGMRDPYMMHQEETLIGETISLYSSVGLGGRLIVESSMNEVMVGMQKAQDLLQPHHFDRVVQDLKEFGGAIDDFFRTMKLPRTQAMDGLADNLNFWLRQLMQDLLSSREDSAVVAERLVLIMELSLAVADTLMIAAGTHDAKTQPFSGAYESVLKEKLRDLSSDVPNRSALLKSFLQVWFTNRLTGTTMTPTFTAKPLRLDTTDIRMWDLARTLLNQNDLELFFYAKEVAPTVLGQVLATTLLEKKGKWAQGEEQFQNDFEEIYRRLKYDKFEGSEARTRAIRVLAEAVMEERKDEEEKQKAIDWGCRLLFLYREDFDTLARRQGTEDLKTHLLQQVLPKANITVDGVLADMEVMRVRLGIEVADQAQAVEYALQTHVAQLASVAVWADFEGQAAKCFNAVISTVAFIEDQALPIMERLGCSKDDLLTGLARDDAKQLAGIASRMMGRKHYSRAGSRLLDLLGYATDGGE